MLGRPLAPSMPVPFLAPELLSLVNRGAASKAGAYNLSSLKFFYHCGVSCCRVRDAWIVAGAVHFGSSDCTCVAALY